MEPKTYLIDGHEFRLKDLTLDESEEVNQILKASGSGITISNENSKKFLSIILEPHPALPFGKGEDKGGVDFGKTTESTAAEVLKDFFTSRIQSRFSLINYLSDLPEHLKKSSESTKT